MPTKNEQINQEYLKSILDYNPDTGIFTWLVDRRRIRAGTIAGSEDEKGYIRIKIDGVSYKGHRLAWFYTYGIWPDLVDHKNGIKNQNWLENLRDTDTLGNNQNQVKPGVTNKTGYLGVDLHRTGKYRAQIKNQGKVIYLGLHETPELAHEAYVTAKRQLHSTCTI